MQHKNTDHFIHNKKTRFAYTVLHRFALFFKIQIIGYCIKSVAYYY